MQVSEKEILITKGTAMAIYLTTQLLIRPGDTVFVPEPGYLDANQTFKLAGANLVFIPVDKDGMDVDRIEQLCKKEGAQDDLYYSASPPAYHCYPECRAAHATDEPGPQVRFCIAGR